MTDQTFQLIAIGLYFVTMLGIGYYAYFQTTDLDDYMLAGRKLSPGVADGDPGFHQAGSVDGPR